MATANTWCIVALPEENHPVHKVSSEKSAHMTILFLGEQREPALAIRIIECIQHTIATSFKHKFSLGVQKRGTLGRDQADVLFFYKDECGRVNDFRSLLLKNDDIKKAYDSTTQFPEWTPHLTLGYPDSPANRMPDDNHSISWITFDRIALWLEDSNGPEIELGDYSFDLATPEDAYHRDQMIQKGMVAMESTDDFLAHYGVKGMKWGVRKQSQADSLRRVSTGSASTKDKIRSVGGMSTLDVARGGGSIKRAAAKKADRIEGKISKNDAKRAKQDAAKAKRAAIKKEYTDEIDKARREVTGKGMETEAMRSAWKDTKKREGRKSEGAKAAKEVFKKTRNDYLKTRETANQIRDGREVAEAMFMGMNYMNYRYM